jgi:hypothetical protein
MYLNLKYMFLLIAICGCKVKEKSSNSKITFVHKIDNQQYWDNVTPKMFIDTLIKYPGDVFAIGSPPRNEWYDLNYLQLLNQYVDDKRMCAAVTSLYLNKVPRYKRTNVSFQSKYLIKGIKEKRYPPTLSSVD